MDPEIEHAFTVIERQLIDVEEKVDTALRNQAAIVRNQDTLLRAVKEVLNRLET